jgi:hypothetical protein
VIEHVDSMRQVPAMLAARRAVAVISVPWSPWPRKSRELLAVLEQNREQWSPGTPVQFFDLWPEQEEELYCWYEQLCEQYAPRLALHGHGYGPLWWLTRGVVLDCLYKPYEFPLEELQQRSQVVFESVAGGA